MIPIFGLVIAILGLGNLGLEAYGVAIVHAALRLSITTAYYGAVGAATAGAGCMGVQGTIYVADHARHPGD
jgi:hypothetical protein